MTTHEKGKEKINHSEAKEALLRSGYLIEARIAKILEENGYYVEANAAYQDSVTGKSRELDVYALSGLLVSRDLDIIFPSLLIECINNPQPLVLLTKKPQTGFMFHEDMKLAGLPVKVLLKIKSDEWESLPEFLHMDKFLHFCKTPVATQFCSFSRSKDKWVALHEGNHFDAFQKICDATAYFQDKLFKNYQPEPNDLINIEFYYPVLIVQGDLIEAKLSQNSVSLRKAPHLVYRRTIIQGTEEESYNIDVITEKFFPDYLKIIENEMNQTIKRMKRHKKELYRSIKTISRLTKRLRTPEKIRKMMEF